MEQIDRIRNKSSDEIVDKLRELNEKVEESNLLKRKLLKTIAHLGLVIEDIDQNISEFVSRELPDAQKRAKLERYKIVSKIFMDTTKEELPEETELLEVEKMLYRPKKDSLV